jgi:hypothetical protein
MSGSRGVRVYSGPILAMAAHLKEVLTMNGIESEVRGEYLAGALGEVPVTEAWPELWVLDAARGEDARCLVDEALEAGQGDQTERECPQCHEMVEAQFSECWKCGAAVGRPV